MESRHLGYRWILARRFCDRAHRPAGKQESVELKYLLDTNAFVEHLRNGPESKVTLRILSTQPNSIFLCTMVLAELLYGAIRSGIANEEQIERRFLCYSKAFLLFPSMKKLHSSMQLSVPVFRLQAN
jgi:predicted nucleic acid-binding protein